MPTPYGSRGGMAFSADELRVVRGALAASNGVRDCLRLAAAVDETAREAERMRDFLIADLARYRAALPAAAPGYAELLREALAAGYAPQAADLTALRTLAALPASPAETGRRTALLRRCEAAAAARRLPYVSEQRSASPDVPRPAPRLLALPGGRCADEDKPAPDRQQDPAPARPARPAPPSPGRPVPTPAEVFPPRRKQPPAPQDLGPARSFPSAPRRPARTLDAHRDRTGGSATGPAAAHAESTHRTPLRRAARDDGKLQAGPMPQARTA
ncbi:hypothetical protein [Streptomyces boninensis]|uniref:hypothetical protein n=1 Tax=Streptomyces boninensis TaxID=2039455 RepID=UPI003B219C79